MRSRNEALQKNTAYYGTTKYIMVTRSQYCYITIFYHIVIRKILFRYNFVNYYIHFHKSERAVVSFYQMSKTAMCFYLRFRCALFIAQIDFSLHMLVKYKYETMITSALRHEWAHVVTDRCSFRNIVTWNISSTIRISGYKSYSSESRQIRVFLEYVFQLYFITRW